MQQSPNKIINHTYFFRVTKVPISFFERRKASSMRVGSSLMNLSHKVNFSHSVNIVPIFHSYSRLGYITKSELQGVPEKN